MFQTRYVSNRPPQDQSMQAVVISSPLHVMMRWRGGVSHAHILIQLSLAPPWLGFLSIAVSIALPADGQIARDVEVTVVFFLLILFIH